MFQQLKHPPILVTQPGIFNSLYTCHQAAVNTQQGSKVIWERTHHHHSRQQMTAGTSYEQKMPSAHSRRVQALLLSSTGIPHLHRSTA